MRWLVEDEAVLVHEELRRSAVAAGELPAMRVEPRVTVRLGPDLEGLHIHPRNHQFGAVTDVQREAVHGDRPGEGCAHEVEVVAAVEVDAVGSVHLPPATAAVGRQPQIGLVEVAEEQELAHLPTRRQAEHVLHLFAADVSGDGPGLVLPGDRHLLGPLAVPGGPADRVAVGADGQVGAHRSSVPAASHVTTVPNVINEREALDHVLERCRVLPARSVPLAEVTGLVLAEAVVAAEDVPPFANTAVDGYAVRATDLAEVPVELDVVDEVAAGAHTERVVGPGEAIRIMTGAPMPAGADAAVMVEDTERLDGGARVRVHRSVRAGDAVRGVGDDVRAGEELFAAGTLVTPAAAGVLASVNARSVLAVARPRVAVLSTGDELVDDGSPLAPGQIRESNKTMLLGVIARAGCDPVDFGVVRDDEATLEAVLRHAADECDAVVTSGGVSMGDYDVVKAVLGRIADMRWMQIAIKPAKPFAFGLLRAGDGREVPVFGLPGNPVSSLVSFELFARPGLRKMAGHRNTARPVVMAVADEHLRRRPDGKTHYMRVVGSFQPDGRCHVRSVANQGSHQLAATAEATAFAVVADGDGVPEGASVPVILLGLD